MIYFLLLTAFTVSIDSLVCGFSLSKCYNKKLSVILCVFTVVLVMCFITNYLAKLLSNLSEIVTTVLGSSILVSVGFYNLFKCRNSTRENVKTPTLLLVGFAVGLDGAMANLSLALMGINAFYVPLVIALMHALMVFIGITLASTNLSKKFDKYKFFAPLILIFLGVYKSISLFI